MNVKQTFDERYMTLIGSLNSFGFDSDLYYNISDFTKKIALIPCSARTHEGIPELVMMLCGISQKYLADKLKIGKEPKGVLLEVKKEKSNNYIEAILYDGELKKTNEIAIANFNTEKDPITTKIRILEEIEPLCAKFKPKESVIASTGIRMQLITKEEVLPGMPFEIYKNNLKELKEKFNKEVSDKIKTKPHGIIAKADSLGSLEALLFLLENQNIPVLKVGIGNINKSDIINAKANIEINELDAIIVGFNVEIDEDTHELIRDQGKKIKVITDEVVYKLIEDLMYWRTEKQKAIEKKRLMELAPICKLNILHQYVFRNTSPAIFGVKIEAGKLKQQMHLIDENNEKVGKIKNIESERKSVQEANEGMEVAVSMPGINFERAMKNRNLMYSDLGESQFRNFKKNKDLLSKSEMKALQEIAEIKRKTKADWGI